jgi:hypothetical protein
MVRTQGIRDTEDLSEEQLRLRHSRSENQSRTATASGFISFRSDMQPAIIPFNSSTRLQPQQRLERLLLLTPGPPLPAQFAQATQLAAVVPALPRPPLPAAVLHNSIFLVDITIPRKNYPTLHSTRGERGKADCVAVPDSWFSTSQNPAISLQSSSLPGPLPLSVARHCTRILIRIMPWPHFRTLFRAAI